MEDMSLIKNGNVSIFGNVDEQIGTYKTVGKNEIEIHLTVEKHYDDDSNVTSTPINVTERIKVINENTISINGVEIHKWENGHIVK